MMARFGMWRALAAGFGLLIVGQAVADTAPARPLSLRDAINGALATNVKTLVANAGQAEAAGDRIQARAAFLPHLSGQVGETRRQTNLAAQGFDFGSDVTGATPPGAGPAFSFPTTVTYNNFDARAKLRQTLFDYSAWQKYQGAKVGERVADAQLAVARQQVATQAELDYVALASARAEVTAARADVHQAKALLKLAHDQQHVGVATGLDVTRARARLARDTATLAQRQADAARQRIQLAYTVGLPLGAPITLTSPLVFRPMPVGKVTADIRQALASRPEVALARLEVARGQHQLASAKGQRLPTLSLNADYGESGNTPDRHSRPTYAVGAELSLPIFNGGAIAGAVDSAASQLDQQQIRYRNTREEVAADVRKARESLTQLATGVRAARTNLQLASQQLKQSQDRFAHGVADNVEVIQAQAGLASARTQSINALAEYTRARINLAAALGRAPQFSLRHPMTP